MGGLTHVALFTWKPGTTDDEIDELSQGLSTLPDLIPEVRGYWFGPDAGLGEGNHDFAVVADFDSVDGYLAYAAHPAHRAVVEGLLRPILDQRSAVQVERHGR